VRDLWQVQGHRTWRWGRRILHLRSIDNVLRSGLPHFACGGYYNRGSCISTSSPASASWGSARSLPALRRRPLQLGGPAGGLLVARRARGAEAGWLTVIILSVSIWEIEMGRFARMYAPFQAVFMWYLLFFLRYTIDVTERRSAG